MDIATTTTTTWCATGMVETAATTTGGGGTGIALTASAWTPTLLAKISSPHGHVGGSGGGAGAAQVLSEIGAARHVESAKRCNDADTCN